MNILERFRTQLRGHRRVLMFGPAATTVPTAARTLLENAEFHAAFIEASEIVEKHRGWSLLRALYSDAPPDGVTSSERNFVQEVVFQLALFRALAATDAEYDAVAGISLGDAAAAHAAGMLSFEETLYVSCEIIRAVLSASGGDLLAVQASPERVREIVGDAEVTMIVDWPLRSVWAVPDECAPLMQRQLRDAGIRAVQLGFNCLSHTRRIDVPGLTKALARLPNRQLTCRLYSTLEGGMVSETKASQHFVRMISEPVKLEGMWRTMREDGYTDILYIGSVDAERDVFRGLPRSQLPTWFKRAESCIFLGNAQRGTRISAPADTPSSIAAAIGTPRFARDPFPHYRRWLADGVVHRLPAEHTYVVLGYDAVSTVLKNPEVFSSSPSYRISPTLLGADPPDHTRMRRLLTPFFTRDRLAAQRESVPHATMRALDRLHKVRAFDAVQFASGLVFSISCDWLGLQEWQASKLGTTPPDRVKWPDVERALKPDGMVRQMADSNELSRTEIALLMPFLISAGASTTRDLILLSMHTLLRRRDLLEELTSSPALVSPFIDEMLRYEPPVHGLVRRTRGDAVLQGIEIPAGSKVWVFLAAANRDETKFERAHEFVLGREGPRHISFGSGPHFCIGNHIGRAEAELIVPLILTELARLTVAQAPQFYLTDIGGDTPWLRSMKSWRLAYTRR